MSISASNFTNYHNVIKALNFSSKNCYEYFFKEVKYKLKKFVYNCFKIRYKR